MDISKNKKWLRKAAYAPLAAAVLAGAVCSGAGIGSAATDTDAGVGTGTSASKFWMVNGTGQPIYGTLLLDSAMVERTKYNPWGVGESESGEKSIVPFRSWHGRICYNQVWWKLPFTAEDASVAHLEVDSQGTLHLVEYDTFLGKTWRTPFTKTQSAC
ncbi:hypothetical protein [Rhodococcus jostii]|uniref:hypothetical protein n=1 Tax=Rhodococcus jostii TaxID=132919 RepID=UPI003645B7F7